jgi:gluconolactonase
MALPLGPLATTYPDPNIEALDKRFPRQQNAGIERIATGCRWNEGPVYFPAGGYFLWSDIPNNRIMRWLEDDGHVSVFRAPSNYANGNARDLQGRLITCEHETRRVTRTEPDGAVTILIDQFEGKPLNAPNDVTVAPDGAIWFTDPGFGIEGEYEGHRAAAELPPNVYRLDLQTGRATIAADDFLRPNGLAFSADGAALYIIETGLADRGPAQIRKFKADDGKLSGGAIFADGFAPGILDGIRTDGQGNIWCAHGWADPAENGVHCYSPDGALLGKIHLPEPCANLCFGGPKQNRLFMTAGTSIYALYLNVQGALCL